MSTADFLLGQITTNYNEGFDAMLLGSNNGALMRSPRTYMYGKTTYGLTNCIASGALQEVYKSSKAPCQNTYDEANVDFYSLDDPFQYPPIRSTSSVQSTSSTPDTDAQSPPSRHPSTPVDHIHMKMENSQSKQTRVAPKTDFEKRETKTKKTAEPIKTKLQAKKRWQRKREAGVASKRTTKETEKQDRPKTSLERNRIAANKCRERKKQWTEKLEEKKSGLEATRGTLQAEYSRLHQESSQLKNYLISHASCHDPNIDIWISNEASKYALNLSPPSQ